MQDGSTAPREAPAIEHLPEEQRFEARIDGQTATLEYTRVDRSMVLTHTEVPSAFEGRGIGSALVRSALEYVREQDLVAVPLCPFVRAYIRRHPEYRDLVGFGERGERLA